MTNRRQKLIEILMEGEPIPPGKDTFGKLVQEQFDRDRAIRVAGHQHKSHMRMYGRWCKMALRHAQRRFPPEHPIYRDIIVWELYVCRFDIDVRSWFEPLAEKDRIELCAISRNLRKNASR